MRPRLYMNDVTCPCARAVLLTARVLELTLDTRELKGSCKAFIQLNNHTVPILEDSGYVIWDSHAIIAYLVGKYGKDDSLYPRDFQKRTLIDQRLDFESGVMSFFVKTRCPLAFEGIFPGKTDELAEFFNETYAIVEKFFDDNKWIAGDSLTIADLCLIPSITSMDVMVPIDARKFPKLVQWCKRAETMPFYKDNERGLLELRASLKL